MSNNRRPRQRSADHDPSNPTTATTNALDPESLRLLQEEDEEEALRRAIEESCRLHPLYEGYDHTEFFPDAGTSTTTNGPTNQEDEDEQLRRAIEESLRIEEEQKKNKEYEDSITAASLLEESALEIQKMIEEMEAADRAAATTVDAVTSCTSTEPAPIPIESIGSISLVVSETSTNSPVFQSDDVTPISHVSTVTPASSDPDAIEPEDVDSRSPVPITITHCEVEVQLDVTTETIVQHSEAIVYVAESKAPQELSSLTAGSNVFEQDHIDEEIPAQLESATLDPLSNPIADEDATVVSEEGEDVDDEWELVPNVGQLEGSILLEEYHSDSDDEDAIVEPDIVFRNSPMRSPNESGFSASSTSITSTTSHEQVKENTEDEVDPVVANAHVLLERFGFVAIERQLQEESDEFIEALLREHEQLMQSSVHSLEGRLHVVEETSDEEEYASVISEDEQATAEEEFLSAHSTQDLASAIAEDATVQQSTVTTPVAEYNLSTSQLRALPLDENCLRCPPDVFALLKRGKYEFERNHGVKLSFSNSTDCVITLHHSDPDVVAIAKFELQSIIRDSDEFEQQLLMLNHEHTHIFVDNSNIFIGSQIVGIDKSTKKPIYDYSLRLNHKHVDRVVNHQRNCQKRFVVGTDAGITAPGATAEAQPCLWAKHWEKLGYKVYLHPFGVDGKESVVDSSLIAEITIHIANVERQRRENQDPVVDTLVLLTGDGNNNNSNASIFAAVEHALNAGWSVELWCWRLSASNNYRRLADQYATSGRFSLRFLDNYRDEIVFKQIKKN